MQPELSPELQQSIGMLNLRVNDLMTQINTVLKSVLEENQRLKAENLELKSKVAPT